MKRLFILILLTGTLGLGNCSSNNSGNQTDSDTTFNNQGTNDTSNVASPQGLGADTTSAASDSLRDSLNR